MPNAGTIVANRISKRGSQTAWHLSEKSFDDSGSNIITPLL